MFSYKFLSLFAAAIIFTIPLNNSCEAAGLPTNNIIQERSSGSLYLARIPILSHDFYWAGIGFQRYYIPCSDKYECLEFEYDTGLNVYGLELGTTTTYGDKSEIFLGANAGTRRGLIWSLKMKENPFQTENLVFFVSFVLLF